MRSGEFQSLALNTMNMETIINLNRILWKQHSNILIWWSVQLKLLKYFLNLIFLFSNLFHTTFGLYSLTHLFDALHSLLNTKGYNVLVVLVLVAPYFVHSSSCCIWRVCGPWSKAPNYHNSWIIGFFDGSKERWSLFFLENNLVHQGCRTPYKRRCCWPVGSRLQTGVHCWC